MDLNDVIKQLNVIYCEVFDDDKLVINEKTNADLTPAWDSLGHIKMILAVEKSFKIRFTTAEVAETKKPGQNVGDFARMVLAKASVLS